MGAFGRLLIKSWGGDLDRYEGNYKTKDMEETKQEEHASDASFYRLIPKAVVQTKGLEEIKALFEFSQRAGIPMTFRAAGSSLSGQSISDGLLVEVARHWRDLKVEDGGKRIRVQPGVIGARPTNCSFHTERRSVP